jgi:hypothetical protein
MCYVTQDMRYEITIDRFENDQAVLKTEDGQTIIWPKKLLPTEAGEGMIFEFDIQSQATATDSKKQEAKNLLNELLNTEEK